MEGVYHLEELISCNDAVIGIADKNNTFAHSKLERICKHQNKKPIFGVRLMAVESPNEKVRPRGQYGATYILIAKNQDGLIEIHKLVQKATKCFYYRAHIGLIDIWSLSINVIVLFLPQKKF
jgi:DNA polymerase III alpha subunit